MRVRVLVDMWFSGPDNGGMFEKVCELVRLPVQGEHVEVGAFYAGSITHVIHDAGEGSGYVATVKVWPDNSVFKEDTALAAVDCLLRNGFVRVQRGFQLGT